MQNNKKIKNALRDLLYEEYPLFQWFINNIFYVSEELIYYVILESGKMLIRKNEPSAIEAAAVVDKRIIYG